MAYLPRIFEKGPFVCKIMRHRVGPLRHSQNRKNNRRLAALMSPEMGCNWKENNFVNKDTHLHFKKVGCETGFITSSTRFHVCFCPLSLLTQHLMRIAQAAISCVVLSPRPQYENEFKAQAFLSLSCDLCTQTSKEPARSSPSAFLSLL